MATEYARVGFYNSTAEEVFALFAESSEGYFDQYSDVEARFAGDSWASSYNPLRVAVVPKVSGYYCSGFVGIGSNITETEYGLLTYTALRTGNLVRARSSSSSSGVYVQILDEHGTHVGSPTGMTRAYGNQVLGVLHQSADEGYIFTGWRVTRDGSSATYGSVLSAGGTEESSKVTFFPADYGAAVVVQAPKSTAYQLTIEAVYEVAPPTYTLTYDANGGSPTPSAVSATEGSSIMLAAAPTKSGYVFAGWVIGSSVYPARASYTLTGDATAVAAWSETGIWFVSFDKNADDVSGADIPAIRVDESGSIVVPYPDAWVRAGYAFVKWNTSSTGSGIDYAEGAVISGISADVVLYAQWAATEGNGAAADWYRRNTSDYNKGSYSYWYNIWIGSNLSRNLTVQFQTRGRGDATKRVVTYANNAQSSVSTTVTSSASSTYYSGTVVSGAEPATVLYPGLDLNGVYGYIQFENYTSTWRPTTGYWTETTERGYNTPSAAWKWIAPEVDGYDFDGWYSFSANGSVFDVKLTADRETTWDVLRRMSHTGSATSISGSYLNKVYLKYVGKRVLVLLAANGGDLDDFYRYVTFNQAYGDLPTPTYAGRTFLGWFTEPAGGTEVTVETVMTRAETHTLFAHWSDAPVESHTLTFDAAGGSVSVTSRSVAAGATLGTLPTPTRSNYAFDGWYTAEGTQVSSTTVMPDDDLIVYARWTANTFTVTFNANGGTASETTRSVPYGRQILRLPSAWKDGGRLLGWYTSASGGTKIESTDIVTSNMTLYARWGKAVDWWVVEPV